MLNVCPYLIKLYNMEVIGEVIKTTLDSFDFGYCIIVSVLTYLTIVVVNDLKKNKLQTWGKRGILLAIISFTGVLYYLIGSDTKLLINSAILSPVFWSWVMKPICKRFKIDYKDIDAFEKT